MTVAYIDCFAGISGDMLLGALVDAGYPLARLQEIVHALGLPGIELQASRVERHGLVATRLVVVAPREHAHRGLSDLQDILSRSRLPGPVVKSAGDVFRRLAEAEAGVHGTTVEEVRFHEVGAVDAIVDVVGAVSGLAALGVEAVYASKLRFGTGMTRGAHGSLPIPVPAVVALCKGVPAERTMLPFEMVTPTGAALLTTLATRIGEPITMRTDRIGYGAGARDPDQIANVLRLEIGESDINMSEGDAPLLIETNIDDTTPQIYGYLLERLLEAGARDAWLTPIIMKKGRPGITVSVLSTLADAERLAGILFRETTTIGVRMHGVTRRTLPRSADTVQTPHGPVRVKRVTFEGNRRTTPEFDDCARIAREKGVPILDVYRSVEAAVRAEGE